MIIVKLGASIEGIRSELLVSLILVIAPIFYRHQQPCVVTSGSEKFKHSARRSRHYSGDALDLRTRFFTDEEKREVAQELRDELGPDFYVAVERTHFHVQYSPMYSQD